MSAPIRVVVTETRRREVYVSDFEDGWDVPGLGVKRAHEKPLDEWEFVDLTVTMGNDKTRVSGA